MLENRSNKLHMYAHLCQFNSHKTTLSVLRLHVTENYMLLKNFKSMVLIPRALFQRNPNIFSHFALRLEF